MIVPGILLTAFVSTSLFDSRVANALGKNNCDQTKYVMAGIRQNQDEMKRFSDLSQSTLGRLGFQIADKPAPPLSLPVLLLSTCLPSDTIHIRTPGLLFIDLPLLLPCL